MAALIAAGADMPEEAPTPSKMFTPTPVTMDAPAVLPKESARAAATAATVDDPELLPSASTVVVVAWKRTNRLMACYSTVKAINQPVFPATEAVTWTQRMPWLGRRRIPGWPGQGIVSDCGTNSSPPCEAIWMVAAAVSSLESE